METALLISKLAAALQPFILFIFFFTHDSFAHSEMSWSGSGLIMEDNGCFFVNSHIDILASLASRFGALSGEGAWL